MVVRRVFGVFGVGEVVGIEFEFVLRFLGRLVFGGVG